ncbi:hypothetical protein Emed_007630 [Eimeria media]
MPEMTEEMEEDAQRRLRAFERTNAHYPSRAALGNWPARPDYAGPHLRLVIERYDSDAPEVAAVVSDRRYMSVRYPTELPRFPGAHAQLHEGPSWVTPSVPYDPPRRCWEGERW